MPTRTGKYSGLVYYIAFTPNGSSLTAYTGLGITNVEPTKSEQILSWAGDGATFATLKTSTMSERGLKLTCNDVSRVMNGLPSGPGTLLIKVKDAVNTPGTAGSGMISYSLANAVRSSSSGSHQAQQANSGTIEYTSYSSDGSTDPLTITEE